MLAAAATSIFARPKHLENLTVKDYTLRQINTSTAGQYIRVQGMFDPDEAYQKYLRLSILYERNYSSGDFVALADPSSGNVMWVARNSVSALKRNDPITLVGQITFGVDDSEPPFYMVAGDPPNVRLANFLARAGLVLLGIGAVVVALAYAIHRVNYALPALWQPAAIVNDAPNLLWYGGLGRQFDDAVIQSEPGRFVPGIHEGRLESVRVPGMWSVSIRRLRNARLFDLATPTGPLPAARISFEDERGMQRAGVIAAHSPAERDAVLQLLSLIRN